VLPIKRRLLASVTALVLALVPTMQSTAFAASSLNFDDAANGRTVTVAKGKIFTISLSSTYWQLDPISKSSPVKQQGQVSIVANPPGAGTDPACSIPGSGCGTQSWKFKALAKGTKRITFSRTSCGEAMRCTPKQSRFTLMVKVS